MQSSCYQLTVNKYERSPFKTNFKVLADVGKEYTYILRLQKSKGWKKFCENVTCEILVSDLWLTVRILLVIIYSHCFIPAQLFSEFFHPRNAQCMTR